MSLDRVAVCVFAKPPLPGRAKTRLIPAVGAQGAARLAQAFLTDTLALLRSVSWVDPVLATTQDGLREGFAPSTWGDAGPVPRWIQPQATLDVRIEHILRRALEDWPAAIALGADSPGLPASHLERLRLALLTHDAVIGPTEDGGFYALGLRRCPAGLLSDVPWSSPQTAARTLAALVAHGLAVEVIDEWWDVDEPEDLARLADLTGPCTAATRDAMTRPYVDARAIGRNTDMDQGT